MSRSRSPLLPRRRDRVGLDKALRSPRIRRTQPASAPAECNALLQSSPLRRNRPSFLFDPPTIQASKGNTFVVNLLISGRAERLFRARAVQLRSEDAATGKRLEWRIPLARRPGSRAGASRGRDAGTIADHGHAASGRWWSLRPGRRGHLTFMAKTDGQTPLTITRGGARDPGLQAITVNGAQAAVTVQ